MMHRRGILGLFAASPLAAVAAQEPSGVSSLGQVGVAGVPRGPSEGWRKASKLAELLDSKTYAFDGPLPADIASKKSWSPVFKEAAARARERQAADLRRTIQDLQYVDDCTDAERLVKLMAIAKRMGVKV
jgi:hypothetical protein